MDPPQPADCNREENRDLDFVQQRKENPMSITAKQIDADVQPSELIDVAVRNGRENDDIRELSRSFAIHETNVLACRPYDNESRAVVLLVTLDETKLQQVLDEAGLEYNPQPSVLIRSRYGLGFAARIGIYLQEAGIKILCSYASPSNRDTGCIVLKTTDDEAAVRLLKDCPWGTSIAQACFTHPRKLLAAQWVDPGDQERIAVTASDGATDAKLGVRVQAQSRSKGHRNVVQRRFDPTHFDMHVR